MMRTLRSGSTRPGLAIVVAMVMTLASCSIGGVRLGPDAIKGKQPDGFIDMQEVQAAYIGSGSTGKGNLFYQGVQYPFTVGGLGVGGVGLSTIDANGDVYNLTSVAQFPGTYGQARYGFAIGTESGGDLWLQNEQGVILHLKAKRTGLMLSLGGDAMVISMAP